MSDVRPFAGLRPRADLVAKVAAPPYDVLNSDEARAMAAGNPYSFLHVSKSEIDLPPHVDVHSEAVYDKARETFRRFVADAVLVRDPVPCFYVYELTMGSHVQHGFVIGASVDEYERDLIKKHELTRRAKEDDRVRHTESIMANAGPVLLTYRARPDLGAILANTAATPAATDFVAPDGIRHRLWVISDGPSIGAIRDGFAALDALYVADGHHRSASAFRVRDRLRAANPRHTGDEPYNHFLAVAFPDDELRILGYHRVVKDLHGQDERSFLARVSERFDVAPSDAREPAAARLFKLFLGGAWYELRAKEGSFPADDPVRSLDVAILQENLLAPILGIEDPRSDERIDFVGGIRGMKELERRATTDMKVALACHPVSVAQLMAIADSGAIMPPKSTWFEPKLRSGVVVRSLED